ncbi:hypothetical protein GCM10007175_07890 [Pseudarthrobacter scleromae]|uniref:Uncharacterized protein n=1 Tax=Pseudarthrobacter scleromae TaxID=158897 RepID=A0ABQ2CCI9_9MICC|nr:hypothetical protein GCM10007175_07890 [Pseudarthrobacter scleromae]
MAATYGVTISATRMTVREYESKASSSYSPGVAPGIRSMGTSWRLRPPPALDRDCNAGSYRGQPKDGRR